MTGLASLAVLAVSSGSITGPSSTGSSKTCEVLSVSSISSSVLMIVSESVSRLFKTWPALRGNLLADSCPVLTGGSGIVNSLTI